MTAHVYEPPPDTPSSAQYLMMGGVAGAAVAMTAGVVDLATYFTTDCLPLLNLILGLLELGLGTFLLWWVISNWLRNCHQRLAHYGESLARSRRQLDEYYHWLEAQGQIRTGQEPPGGAPSSQRTPPRATGGREP